MPTDSSEDMSQFDTPPVSSGAAAAAGIPRSAAGNAGAVVRVGGLDGFSRAAGPDVTRQTAGGLQRLYAVYTVEPGTRNVQVHVVNESGAVVRMIPQRSVAEMISTMAAYSRI